MPKIIVCSIALNEEKFVRRWAESAKDADAIYMLDTGSTDNTVKIAKECGIIVIKKTFKPWRFDVARNYLLDKIPSDIDWLVHLDLDEIIMPGWRKAFDNVDDAVTRIRYKYQWNHKQRFYLPDGSDDIEKTLSTPNNEGLIYHGDKIVKRFGYRYSGAVHEVNMRQKDASPEFQAFSDDIKIIHFADDHKSRNSYLPLLLIAAEEEPNNDRTQYYCARELMYKGQVEASVALFKKHIAMPEATWDAERSFSMRYIAQMVPKEREHWLLRAVAEYPHGREPWVDLAQHYHNTNNWHGCYYAASQALALTNKGDAYLTEAHSWGWAPHDLLALAAAKLGMTDLAIQAGKNAISFAPEDERLKDNLYFYKREKAKVDVVIPFKSNIEGLTLLISQLKVDGAVSRIVVVADGEEAYSNLNVLPNDIIRVMLPASVGNIHKMWNLGLRILGAKNHIAFINDDVSLADNCISNCLNVMLRDSDIGLISPNYTTNELAETLNYDYEVFGVSGSRYDGFGGFAGFCFIIAKDLIPFWHFDESLKWMGGDNLLVEWVTKVVQRKAIVTHKARCLHDDHKTFYADAPEDWSKQRQRDSRMYDKLRATIEESESYA